MLEKVPLHVSRAAIEQESQEARIFVALRRLRSYCKLTNYTCLVLSNFTSKGSFRSFGSFLNCGSFINSSSLRNSRSFRRSSSKRRVNYFLRLVWLLVYLLL